MRCEFCFILMLGIGNFNKSTLKKIIITEKNFFMPQKKFDKWVFAGGKKLPGLQSRRTKKEKIFEGRKVEDYQDSELDSLIENLGMMI